MPSSPDEVEFKLDDVIKFVENHKDMWEQGSWAYAVNGDDPSEMDRNIAAKLADIESIPDEACGTSFCIAGWACVLNRVPLRWAQNGYTYNDLGEEDQIIWEASFTQFRDQHGFRLSVREAAAQLLGLTDAEAADLFSGNNEWNDIEKAVARIKETRATFS